MDFIDDAKKFRKAGKWDQLAEKLYGISHYLGDLTQPLHLHHDYDGEEAGLPDIHAQFESKMINRFEEQSRAGIKARLVAEKIPEVWLTIPIRELLFDTAAQTNLKVERFFSSARTALVVPKQSRRRKANRPAEPRFDKKILWQNTGEIALNQLAIGARLWAHTINFLCR